MTSPKSMDHPFRSIRTLPNLAADVPQIKILREELDYGEKQLPRYSAFKCDIETFRKKFETEGGIPGYRLYEWKSHDHGVGLDEMTHEYLEIHGSGPKFWPDDKASQFYNKLQYSTHHEYIKWKVLQLLWRLNHQQQRNDRHKVKRQIKCEDKMRRHREKVASNDAPIGSTSPNTSPNANASMALSNSHCSTPRQCNATESYIRATFCTIDDEPAAPAAPLPRMQFEPTVDGQTSNAETSQGQSEELPNIPESAVTERRAIFRVFPRSNSADGNRSADETNNERQRKRTKLRQDAGTEYTEYTRKKVGPLRSYRRVEPRPVRQRWSDRRRAERQLFGAATQEQLAQLDEELEFLSEDDESSGQSGSNVRPKLLVELNTKPCVISDLAREEATGNADGAVSGTLGGRMLASMEQMSVITAATTAGQILPLLETVTVSTQEAPAPAKEVPVQDLPESGASMSSLPVTELAAASPRQTVEPEVQGVRQQHEDGIVSSTQESFKQERLSTQKPTLGKPNIRVRYRVILSRNPVLRCRYWKPKGAFRDMSWSQLKEEIPLKLGADTKGLRFRLTGPGLSTDEEVLHGEDEEFEVVKTDFERMIRACVPKGVAGGEPPIFVMEMEALTDDAGAAGEVYEEAFAW